LVEESSIGITFLDIQNPGTQPSNGSFQRGQTETMKFEFLSQVILKLSWN